MSCNSRRVSRFAAIAHCLGCIIAAFPTISLAITPGQVDDFQDGGLAGWTGGGGGSFPSAQMNIASGGPSGAGDRYLQLAAGGTGGAPRLLGVNQSQWTGNFVAADVAGLGMNLLNP